MKSSIKINHHNIEIWVVEENNKIIEVSFEDPLIKQKDTPVLLDAKKQLIEYLDGKRIHFDLPISFYGTDFQHKTWNELLKVEYGGTISYKELCNRITDKKAYRAIGSACNKNPISIIVPCHRVVASNGIGGYAGGLELKNKLLSIEKASIHLN